MDAITYHADGNTSVGPAPAELEAAAVAEQEAAAAESEKLSAAGAFLARKRAVSGGVVVPFSANGETFYCKRMTWREQGACVIAMPLAGGYLDTGDEEAMAHFMAAMIFHGVAKDADGGRFCETMEEANAFVADPLAAQAVWDLFGQIDLLNNLIPKNVAAAAPATMALPDASTSLASSPESGSTATPGTA